MDHVRESKIVTHRSSATNTHAKNPVSNSYRLGMRLLDGGTTSKVSPAGEPSRVIKTHRIWCCAFSGDLQQLTAFSGRWTMNGRNSH